MSSTSDHSVWRAPDFPGYRQFVQLDGEASEGDSGRLSVEGIVARGSGSGFTFEGGGDLETVSVAFETWGTLDADRSNAILVLHALTGDSHATGPAGPGHLTPGWWSDMIGPGAALDTGRYFVVCPNVLGGCQGTTGPGTLAGDGRPYGSRFPLITIRDQVRIEAALADALGIARWAAVVGGSMGGMRALEWAVGYPERAERVVVLATGAYATADQIALASLQIRTIRNDPYFAGGDYYTAGRRPVDGLSVARGIGQYSYRNHAELEQRFGRQAQAAEEPLQGGRFAIESYLEHHGAKLAQRFDANSYIVLSEALNLHDVGRGRGGVAAALRGVTAQMTVVGIASDRLYPLQLQEELVGLLPASTHFEVIDSAFGHDGFLLESIPIAQILRYALDSSS